MRHPLPYAFARTAQLLLEDDGHQLVLWHGPSPDAGALSEVLRKHPVQQLLPLDEPAPPPVAVPQAMAGKKCSECGAHAVIRKDGCDYCTQCGAIGSCG